MAWHPKRPHSRYDVAIVERCIAGALRDVKLSTAERERVVYTLRQEGLTDPAISRRTGIPARTVLRVRGRLGLAAVPRFVVGIKNARKGA